MAEDRLRFKLSVYPLTPVHIASGEWLDPTQYTIVNNRLYVFNQTRLISRLMSREPAKLKDAIGKGHGEISKFFAHYFDPSETDTWSQCHPVPETETNRFLADMENPGSQQLISMFIRNSLTGDPYLPGSSLKGMIRTALAYDTISAGASLPKTRDGRVDARDLEPSLFGYINRYNNRPDITSDPFKYIKVSDAMFDASALSIRLVSNLKAVARTPQNSQHSDGELDYICQVLNSGTLGIVAIVDVVKGKLGINDPVGLAEKCQNYFKARLAKDAKFWLNSPRKATYDKINELVAQNQPGQFLARLGRGSGSIYKSVIDLQTTPITRNLIEPVPIGLCRCKLEEL